MNNFRVTLVLLVLAIAVIGGVAVAQKNVPTPQPPTTPVPTLFDAQPSDIVELDVKSKDKETDVTRDNGKWKLVKPDQDPNVDQDKIASTVAGVAQLKGTRSVASSSDDLKQFGLDQPQLIVTLKLQTGNATQTVLFGSRTIDGNGYFAMKQGGSEVAVVASSVPNDLIGFASTPPKATPTPTATPTAVATPTPAVTPTPAPAGPPAPSAATPAR